MNLQGRRVLVTRPAGQADFLLHDLRAHAADVLHLPLLAIAPLNEKTDAEKIQQGRALVQQLDSFNKIIFISTNAVAYGATLMESFWPQWPIGIEWYGIGSATVRAMQAHDIVIADGANNAALGCATLIDNAMTSESLLSLPAFANLQQQRILIVQGEGGRELLSPVMQQRGARVDNLICYRRAVPTCLADDWQAIAAQAFDAVLISSGEGLQNWLALPGVDGCKQALLIAPSERVAVQAKAAGFRQVIAAENASDKAMLAALFAALRAAG